MMPEPSTQALPHTTAIDWSTAHRRLEAARTALEHGATLRPEEQKTILRARAQTLAREPRREEAAREALEVVEFLMLQIGDRNYGLRPRESSSLSS